MSGVPGRPWPQWRPDLDDTFVCTAVRPVAPDVATVVLAPRDGGTVAFEAGQYVTVEFEIDGQPVHRCYTIASPPSRPERLAITVKRAAGGVVSPWLHSGGLAVGRTVQVGPPQGDFTLERHPAPAYLFLTAGTGVTPALSVLREAYDLGADPDIVLVHSQPRRGEVPYGRELDWIASMLPRARVQLVCRERDVDVPGVTRGRLDTELLTRLVPDAAGREVFVCGPDGYRAAARTAAVACGVAEHRIHQETFTYAPSAPRRPAGVAESASGSYRVVFRDHGVEVDCPAGTTVLDAAITAGLSLPFSCTEGLCGTCKSTLLAGRVDLRHNGGIRPREIANGKILLCCSTPLSDLAIGA